MCLPCNRQLLATKYHIDEPNIQSYCFHIFCCYLALQQEMHEIGEREEGKFCCNCHGHHSQILHWLEKKLVSRTGDSWLSIPFCTSNDRVFYVSR